MGEPGQIVGDRRSQELDAFDSLHVSIDADRGVPSFLKLMTSSFFLMTLMERLLTVTCILGSVRSTLASGLTPTSSFFTLSNL
eukprot:g27900.t1